jgi:hypothetical protein
VPSYSLTWHADSSGGLGLASSEVNNLGDASTRSENAAAHLMRRQESQDILSRDSSGENLAAHLLRARMARQDSGLGRDSTDDLLGDRGLTRESSSADLLGPSSRDVSTDDVMSSSADDLLGGSGDLDVVGGQREPVSHRLQWGMLLPLYFLQFCESWNSDSLFSYVAFLVLDFSPSLTQDEVGKWAGFIAR